MYLDSLPHCPCKQTLLLVIWRFECALILSIRAQKCLLRIQINRAFQLKVSASLFRLIMYLHEISNILVGRLQEELIIGFWQIGCDFFDVQLTCLRRHNTHRVFHIDAGLDQAWNASLAFFLDLLYLDCRIVRFVMFVNWSDWNCSGRLREILWLKEWIWASNGLIRFFNCKRSWSLSRLFNEVLWSFFEHWGVWAICDCLMPRR